MFDTRSCGVLLHPTSLPGAGGIGTFGPDARLFIDLLARMGMTYWQVLPLTPPACGNSPYSAFSAFAGNPLLIDLEQIVADGVLSKVLLLDQLDDSQVDFDAVSVHKMKVLEVAGARFIEGHFDHLKQEFWAFCNNTPWLHHYALFMALKKRYKGKPWYQWPSGMALLSDASYEKASVQLETEIGVQKYIQWLFFRQWQELRSYANSQGIAVIGDIPIFVGYDSADVWSHRELFLLDAKGKPTAVAGVPPDYFSVTGQLWGNPLYNWEVLEQQGFAWWIERFRAMFGMYDVVRIDHFRGFEAAWHVPAKEKTAIHGAWVKAPGRALFDAIQGALGVLPLIAEDLGIITAEVVALKECYGFPGMKIEHFAFDSGAGNPYLPHNHEKNSVVYPGTHDNNTTVGWYQALTAEQRHSVTSYLGCDDSTALEALLRSVLMSVAHTAIIPFQDLLGLDSTARMNVPGTAFGNWGWRFNWSMVTRDMAGKVSERVERYGRCRSLSE